MSDNSPQELEGLLKKAQADLEGIRSSLRKASAVRWVGTLCGFAIVIIYVILFITPILQVKEAVDKGEMKQIITAELKRQRVAEDALYSARTLARELGPLYGRLLWDEVRESGIVDSLSTTAQEVASDVIPVYRKEFDRIRPEIETALTEEGEVLLDDLQSLMQKRVTAGLRATIREQQSTIAEKAELSEVELADRVETVVEATKDAARSMLSKRTTELRRLLEEETIDNLHQIPLAREDAPGELLDQIGKVTVMLLKEKLPTYDVPLK